MAIPKKNQLIGLDIGSHSIKLVEIDHGKQGRVLKNFGGIGLPPDAIVEGSIKEMELVSSAITSLFKNLKIKSRNVATSISGYSVIVKKIALSNREESEIEATIQEEAEQYIPFDISEVNLDFDVLNTGDRSAGTAEEGEQEGAEQMEVMLVAAKKDIIDDYDSLLRLAELSPGVLDVDAFALQNAFEVSTEEPEGCYALVNVGAEELGINAIKDGVSLFTRDSSFGGSQITEGIMSDFKVNFEEAEKIKLGGTEVDKEKGRLEEIFTSVVSEWALEIKRALDFVASTYPDETIEKIFISGGSCRIPGFQEYLKLETGIQVVELNPFASLIIDEKRFDPGYLKFMAPQAAVAVGLALRSIGDK
ncbi:MAG: type IV pilus assembly protein PilM [Desulfobacteraceae bacterium]|nr:MAG: type IV pilus assembly protein PilM [Desulfobacteraceae bacterium]